MAQQITQAGKTAGQGLKQVGTDAKTAQQALTQAERAAQQTSVSLDRTGSSAVRAGASWAAMGAALATVGGILSDASRQSAEAEVSQARLEAAVDATGESYDRYAVRLDAAAEAATRLAFDDEKAQDALSTLTQLTNDAGESLNLLGLAEDLARGKGIDLATAAQIVGKVHEGNTAILQRYGIAVQEGATAQQALAELQARFAGQAEAYANTQQASIDRIRIGFGNLMETVGEHTGGLQTLLAVMPGISAGYTLIGGAAGKAAEGIKILRAESALASVALGPVGMVAAGIAGVAILGELTDWFGLAGDGADDYAMAVGLADGATQGFADTLYGLRTLDPTLFFKTEEILSEADEVIETTSKLSQAYEDYRLKLSRGFSPEDAAEAYGFSPELLDRMGLMRDQVEEFGALITELTGRFDDSGVDATRLATDIDNLIDSFQRGEITAQALIDGLEAIKSGFNDTYLAVTQATTAYTGYRVAVESSTTATEAYTQATESAALATDEHRSRVEAAFGAFGDARDEALLLRSANETLGSSLDDFGGRAIAAEEAAAELSAQYQETGAAAVTAAGNFRTWVDQLTAADLAHLSLTDGIISSTDALALYKETQDGLIGSQAQYTGQLGEYRTQLGYLQDAEDLLRQRQANGVALTEDQLDFLNRVDAAQERLTGGTEDATIALGEQALQYGENMSIGDRLNETVGDTATAVEDLSEVLKDLIAALEGLPKDTKIQLDDSDVRSSLANLRAMAGLKDGLGTGVNRQIPQQPYQADSGPAAGGGVPYEGPILHFPGEKGGAVLLTADNTALLATIADSQQAIQTGLVDPQWMATLLADGSEATSAAQDTGSAIHRVVDDDYTALIEGDPTGAVTATTTAASALGGIDGSTATVYIGGDRSAFDNTVAGIAGQIVGTAYMTIQPIASFFGVNQPNYRHGGIVPELDHAQHGLITRGMRRVVTDEAGGEIKILPDRTAVIPAPLSNSIMRGQGGGKGDVHIHVSGDLVITESAGSVYDTLVSAAYGSNR